jgi:hypothetical protein
LDHGQLVTQHSDLDVLVVSIGPESKQAKKLSQDQEAQGRVHRDHRRTQTSSLVKPRSSSCTPHARYAYRHVGVCPRARINGGNGHGWFLLGVLAILGSQRGQSDWPTRI